MIHTGEKPFACTYPGCESKYSRRALLRIHIRQHTGEQPFQCDKPDCDRAFADKSNLKAHLKAHLRRENLQRGVTEESVSQTPVVQ